MVQYSLKFVQKTRHRIVNICINGPDQTLVLDEVLLSSVFLNLHKITYQHQLKIGRINKFY